MLLTDGRRPERVKIVPVAVGTGRIAEGRSALRIEPKADVPPVRSRLDRRPKRHGEGRRIARVTGRWACDQLHASDSDVVGGARRVAPDFLLDAEVVAGLGKCRRGSRDQPSGQQQRVSGPRAAHAAVTLARPIGRHGSHLISSHEFLCASRSAVRSRVSTQSRRFGRNLTSALR